MSTEMVSTYTTNDWQEIRQNCIKIWVSRPRKCGMTFEARTDINAYAFGLREIDLYLQ
jgi:hypothetical protein